MNPRIDQLAKILWNYHHLNHELRKSDCIFVLGSHDTRVADYAADLYLNGYAPLLVLSGGFGNFTKGVFLRPEAEIFADIARQKGVPETAILIENKSTNTGENVRFTRALLEERGREVGTFILVQKPFMERRTYATFMKNWPEKEFLVTSPPISYEGYPNVEINRELMISVMVGDLQRIKIYPEKGFQIEQDIPGEVWTAYEELVKCGYDKHLVR